VPVLLRRGLPQARHRRSGRFFAIGPRRPRHARPRVAADGDRRQQPRPQRAGAGPGQARSRRRPHHRLRCHRRPRQPRPPLVPGSCPPPAAPRPHYGMPLRHSRD
jgi:hypothetical protein